MIKNVYALRDVKSHWTDPFVDESDEAAKRGVAMMVQRADPNSLIAFQPRDFDLYCIGQYDTVSGELFFNSDHTGKCYPMFLGNAATIGVIKDAD